MLFIHLSFVFIDCEVLGRGSVLSTAKKHVTKLKLYCEITVTTVGNVPRIISKHVCEVLSVLHPPGPSWGEEALLSSSHTRTHKDEKPGNCVRARKPQQSQSPGIAPRWGGTLQTPLLRQTTPRLPADVTQALQQDLCLSELMGPTDTLGHPTCRCLILHAYV